jgi:hypothetical protein
MADGAIEMYDSGRYFALTGRAMGPLILADYQELGERVYRRRLRPRRTAKS